jgi:LacI family transcriptional regulator
MLRRYEHVWWGVVQVSKPNYRDIAELAGVGTATVERVLNGRGGVRPDLVEKVVVAARALNYPRTLPETHRGLLRIDVLMVRPETTFYRRLSQAFQRIAETLDPLVVVHRSFTEEMKPEEIARRILSAEVSRAGLILAVPNHPLISAAVEAVIVRGVPVVHVVTRASHDWG